MNKDYCREWHANNRERSRELSKAYYQKISAPIPPQENIQTVTVVLRGTKSYLLKKDIILWNRKDWKIFQALKNGATIAR